MKHRVNVYDPNLNIYDPKNIVGRVQYNNCLDYWTGSCWQNGGAGLHKGITRLRDGRYVIIYGTDWQGGRDYATVVSDATALKEIIKADKLDLLNRTKFKKLKELYQKTKGGNENEISISKND